MLEKINTGESISEWISRQVPDEFYHDLPDFITLDFFKWREDEAEPLIWLYWLMMQTAGQCAIYGINNEGQSREEIEQSIIRMFAVLVREQFDFELQCEVDDLADS